MRLEGSVSARPDLPNGTEPNRSSLRTPQALAESFDNLTGALTGQYGFVPPDTWRLSNEKSHIHRSYDLFLPIDPTDPQSEITIQKVDFSGAVSYPLPDKPQFAGGIRIENTVYIFRYDSEGKRVLAEHLLDDKSSTNPLVAILRSDQPNGLDDPQAHTMHVRLNSIMTALERTVVGV